MFRSTQTLTRSAVALIGLAALAGAFGLGTVVAQQTPATKVSQLMTKTLADVPGREVMMITLDIPPGGGSPAHRHPGAHNFGYVLEGAYKYKLDNGPETVATKGADLLRVARASFTRCRATRARPSPPRCWCSSSTKPASRSRCRRSRSRAGRP